MNELKKHKTILLREYIFEITATKDGITYRSKRVLRLTFHPNYPESDPNRWRVEQTGGALDIYDSSGQRESIDKFVNEVRRFWAEAREIEAAGGESHGRFTFGSLLADG